MINIKYSKQMNIIKGLVVYDFSFFFTKGENKQLLRISYVSGIDIGTFSYYFVIFSLYCIIYFP